MESDRTSEARGAPVLRVQLFGPMTVSRHGQGLTLPGSRKVRALFAYLALAPLPVSRGHLCELLWEVPNDPRGELRWCLSKIRRFVDDPERPRVLTQEDSVRLDLTDCFVDAIEVAGAIERGIEPLALERQRALALLFNGDLLEGLEIDRSPVFNGWLTAQRRRFRSRHAALLEHLVARVPDEESFGHLEQWLVLAPFDRRVHEILLTTLARHGRIREGEEHLAATARLFESEGLDWAPIRELWRSARAREATGTIVRGAARPSSVTTNVAPRSESVSEVTAAPRRASIAVMPFADRSLAATAGGGTADALAHDIITRLAQLRSLFVIAQGTVFALHERGVGSEEAGRMLDVDYVVGGTVLLRGRRLNVAVELAETRTARIIWAEVFDQPLDDAFFVLDEIGNRIVASVASEIEATERNRAILRPPNSLDAWEAHHRGLWHMYRFNPADNARARHFFEMAVQLDPTFSRAYAGLSFTHFQNAFQGWAERAHAVDRAFEAAGQSLMVDDRDPAAHWALGRALWLRGSHEPAVAEVEQAIDLSPNFALGHYALSFIQSQAGDAAAAIVASDQARRLSPFDPLLFGMLGSRAMALVRLGRFDEAADWAIKAASRANAHTHILAIAAYCLALAGSDRAARSYLATIHKTSPGYGVDDFLRAFQFDPKATERFRDAAGRIGLV